MHGVFHHEPIIFLINHAFFCKFNLNNMGYIKEPKGVDFVVESTPLTPADKKMISDAISLYKATGKITRAPIPKRDRSSSTKKVKE